jgi:uncharacterized protein YndB with AHSA1/START domain
LTRFPVTRKIEAPKDRVWRILADLEGWERWAPLNARNRISSNHIVARDGDAVVCEQEDQLGWAKSSHRGTFTLTPEDGIEEQMTGGVVGTTKIQVRPQDGGTLVSVEDSGVPRGALARLFLALMGRERVVAGFWDDILAQLKALAESPCSPEKPMYCPSRMLDGYFAMPSLDMTNLVNKGGREIDVGTLTVYDDRHWKGIYPPDSLAPAWVFQNGFNKTFTTKDGALAGVTSTFDDNIKGNNRPTPVDPSDPTKGVLLEYTDPQYSTFYDMLKVVSRDVVVGKAFVGKYPQGRLLLNFTMARRYSFDFMTPEDHRELFERYGRAPDPRTVPGEWEGRMVSNASLTPPLFRFWYSVDAAGKVACKWNFMSILKGTSKIELTPDELLMFDFTNFHDEIRMIRDDAMVGRYQPKASKLLDIIGDRDLGLLHFEKTPEGDRPAIYYYIRKVGAGLPAQ